MEECDDGNTIDGDGCTAKCTCEGACPTSSTSSTGLATTTTTPTPTSGSRTSSSSMPAGTTSSGISPASTTNGAHISEQTSPPPISAQSSNSVVLSTSEISQFGSGDSGTGATTSLSSHGQTSDNNSYAATTSVGLTPTPRSTPSQTEAGVDVTVTRLITAATFKSQSTKPQSDTIGADVLTSTPLPDGLNVEKNEPPANTLAEIQNSMLMIEISLILPLTVAEFNDEARNRFRAAMSAASGVALSKVYIIDVVEVTERRLASTSIEVRSAIEAPNDESAHSIVNTLTKTLINQRLTDEGLPAANAVGQPKIVSGEDLKCERISTCTDFGRFLIVFLKHNPELAWGLGAGIAACIFCALAIFCLKCSRAKRAEQSWTSFLSAESDDSDSLDPALVQLYAGRISTRRQKALEWSRYTRSAKALDAWKRAVQVSWNRTTQLPLPITTSCSTGQMSRKQKAFHQIMTSPRPQEAHKDSEQHRDTASANVVVDRDEEKACPIPAEPIQEAQKMRAALSENAPYAQVTSVQGTASAQFTGQARSTEPEPPLDMRQETSHLHFWGPLSRFRGNSDSVEVDLKRNIAQLRAFCTLRSQERCFKGERAYYEVEILDEVSAPQFGFVSGAFERVDQYSEVGVGDDSKGWAMDGKRKTPWHNGALGGYACTWETNDIIGLACDLKTCRISVSLNGSYESPNGLVFVLGQDDIKDGLHAALSGEKGRFRYNFGESPFKYCPPWELDSRAKSRKQTTTRQEISESTSPLFNRKRSPLPTSGDDLAGLTTKPVFNSSKVWEKDTTQHDQMTDRQVHVRMRRSYGWPQNSPPEASKRSSLRHPQLLHVQQLELTDHSTPERAPLERTVPVSNSTPPQALPKPVLPIIPTTKPELEEAALAVCRAREASREAYTPSLPRQHHHQELPQRGFPNESPDTLPNRGIVLGGIADTSPVSPKLSPLLQSTSDMSGTWHQAPRVRGSPKQGIAVTPTASPNPQRFEPKHNLTYPLKSSLLDEIAGGRPRKPRSHASPVSRALPLGQGKSLQGKNLPQETVVLGNAEAGWTDPGAQTSPIICHAGDFEPFPVDSAGVSTVCRELYREISPGPLEASLVYPLESYC